MRIHPRTAPRLLGHVLLLAALWLQGCIAPPARPGAPPAARTSSNDLPTASDESDTARRARIRLELAAAYLEQGNLPVALDEIKQSIALDPNSAIAHNLRGLIYMGMNEPTFAEESFRRSLALQPGDGDALHNYGWLLCQQSRHAEAQQHFARAIASPRYAGQAKSWMTLGVCQMRAGQRAQAESSFNRALELEPTNPAAAFNLATLLYQRGDHARAQVYSRRINDSNLRNAETLWLGIRIERRMGDQVERSRLEEQLRQRFPNSREMLALERGSFDE